MEEDLEPYQLDQTYWNKVEPAGLSDIAIKMISEATVGAKVIVEETMRLWELW
jgi:hypothetical protein